MISISTINSSNAVLMSVILRGVKSKKIGRSCVHTTFHELVSVDGRSDLAEGKCLTGIGFWRTLWNVKIDNPCSELLLGHVLLDGDSLEEGSRNHYEIKQIPFGNVILVMKNITLTALQRPAVYPTTFHTLAASERTQLLKYGPSLERKESKAS